MVVAVNPYSHNAYLDDYVIGTESTTDTALHELVPGIAGEVVMIGSCQIANHSANKDTIVALYDGNNAAAALVAMGCPQLDGRAYDFSPPLVTTAGNGVWFSSSDALTTIYVSVQGFQVSPTYETDWHVLAHDQIDVYFQKGVDGALDGLVRSRYSQEGWTKFQADVEAAIMHRDQLNQLIESMP
jgi:hypothetical protein